jgi:hypothetical protein
MLIDRPQTGVGDTPLSSNFWADKSQTTTGWTFRARVRDEDVLEKLQLQWRIVTRFQKTPEFVREDIPRNGTATRDFMIFVEQGLLTGSECHKLEIAVSGHFGSETRPAYFGQPPMPFQDDVALGTWWLWEGNRDLVSQGQAKQIIDTCDALRAPVVQQGIAGQGE